MGCPSQRVSPQKLKPFRAADLVAFEEPNFSAASPEMDISRVDEPFLVVSAHDDTLMSVLAALGGADRSPLPWFASYLSIELSVVWGSSLTNKKQVGIPNTGARGKRLVESG